MTRLVHDFFLVFSESFDNAKPLFACLKKCLDALQLAAAGVTEFVVGF
ncbi:hypothetical protein CKA32_006373 [Geitlerinema sp. FC II]|nr:hypothetical protein CKA32_006373 [Geitlerinema sp. FC II]